MDNACQTAAGVPSHASTYCPFLMLHEMSRSKAACHRQRCGQLPMLKNDIYWLAPGQ